MAPESEEPCGAVLTVHDPGCWVCGLRSDVSVGTQVLARMPAGVMGMRCAAVIDLQHVPAERVLRAICNRPSVADTSFSSTTRGMIRGIVENVGCLACPAAERAGVFVLKTQADGGGVLEWHVLSSSRGRLSDLVAFLQANGCETQIRTLGPVSGMSGLTPRQGTVLRVARDRGFFDDPRRATLGDLAKEFGISRMAVLRILRRAERNVASPPVMHGVFEHVYR